MPPSAVDTSYASTPKPAGSSKSDTSAPLPHHEEHQYLDLIRLILSTGEHRPDRTGTGTISLFAPLPLRFSLSRPSLDPALPPTPILPLLTTKRVFLRAVVAELLWFISGCTSSKPLSDQGVKIWDGNGSRVFLDSVGLSHREEGDLGPVYGFQWRHFGAEYIDARADYAGKGVDQIADVLDKLRNRPYDRRIVLSAWNPADLTKMALPPCHMFAQFYVSFPQAARGAEQAARAGGAENGTERPTADSGVDGANAARGTLHCQLYQRSCDMGLGVPFNIASYALLTHMLAHAAKLTPGSLTHVMGDAHVYADHVEALRVQLGREPREFPELRVRREPGGDIDGWSAGDFEVLGYEPHKTIPMKMSV